MRLNRMAILVLLTACLAAPTQAAEFSAGLLTGYQGGLAFRASGGISDFAEGFPLAMELGVTYSIFDPGDAFPARRVFIANATNGTPEEYGSSWDFRLDFLYPVKPFKATKAKFYLLAGPRFSLFDGYFEYVGANEAFHVTTNQLGLGLGAKGVFPISKGLSLVILAGLDYYFPGPLEGHDTIYYPDNQNVNPQEDFTYQDATDVINEPWLEPLVMIGLAF